MILVTGATGFLGSYLMLHLLENEDKVRAIYRNEVAIQKTISVFNLFQKEALLKKIDWIQADINDVSSLEIAFKNVTNVYHCAALISFDPKDENQLRKINIEGTANIVNFCLENHIEKLCYVSSIAALGDLKDHESTISEETEWNSEKSHSDYAISKYGAEIEVWRGQQEGLKVVIVNPGVILGYFDANSGSNAIFSRVRKGLSFYTKGSTGFVSVNDVVKVMHLLMNSSINGERFILVSENVTYEKLVKTISKTLGLTSPRYEAKQWMTSFYWKLDWVSANLFLRKRNLSKSMSYSLHTIDLYSNKKISTLFGYIFEEIEQTLKKLQIK